MFGDRASVLDQSIPDQKHCYNDELSWADLRLIGHNVHMVIKEGLAKPFSHRHS